MSLRALISEFCEQHEDATSIEIARLMYDEVPREGFESVLAIEIDLYRRNSVRSVERTAFGAFFDDATVETTPAVMKNLRKVFCERFAIGANVEVEWGKATIEQHRIRIAMLTKLRNGIDSTIERHQNAIRLIEAHNATCLDEIQEAA